MRAKTKARFDEVLKRYTNPPSEKKKAKQIADQSQEIIVVSNSKNHLNLTKRTIIDITLFTLHPIMSATSVNCSPSFFLAASNLEEELRFE